MDESKRPAGVVFAVILTWAAAVVDLITGAALLWLSLNMDGADLDFAPEEARNYGIALLGVGLLTAAVALGVSAGSQLSRVAVMVIMAARLGAAVHAFAVFGDLLRWQALGQAVGSLLIILMLATPRAFRYYRAS